MNRARSRDRSKSVVVAVSSAVAEPVKRGRIVIRSIEGRAPRPTSDQFVGVDASLAAREFAAKLAESTVKPSARTTEE